MIRSVNPFVFIALLVGLLLVACSGSQGPVVMVEGAEETAAALVAFDQNATATAGAALLPTITPVPYIRPTDNPGIAAETVIATVAGHDITVEELRNRVRFERWYALDTLRNNIDIAGLTPESIADPQNTMAPTIIGVLYTLSDAETFAESVLTQMIRERVMHQEYVTRELRPNTALLNNMWLTLVGLSPTGTQELPESFEQVRDEFMMEIAPYTDISLIDLRFKMTVRSEQQTLLDVVGAEADLDTEAREVWHILVATQEEAENLLQQLEEGADFAALAQEYSLDVSARGNGGDLGFFARGETVVPFEEAAFDGAIGEIVGPVQTDFGYHVIEVLEHENAVEVRRILVDSELAATDVMTRLEAGEDFGVVAQDASLISAEDGELGFYVPGSVPESWAELIFSAEAGDVVGPLLSADGYSVLEITDQQVYRVHARHILVETEDEAAAVVERLNDGEDFAALAAELSLDPGARGNGGNQGFLTSDQMPESLAEAVSVAAIGEVFGPVETEYGYHVGRVTDSRLSMLAPTQYDEVRALHFQNWLRREVRAFEIDDIWRETYPSDPQPADLATSLAAFEDAMNEALGAMSRSE